MNVAADVGATLHIEPTDTPRAGNSALAWFALTHRGGETIPLADCDCQLAIFADFQPDTPVLEPELKPVDAEGYQDIPGADIVFPQVGAYELVLSGTPQTEADFAPFELSYDVTVAAGQTAAPDPTSPESPAESPASSVESPAAPPAESPTELPSESPASVQLEGAEATSEENTFSSGMWVGVAVAVLSGVGVAAILIRGKRK